MKRFLKLIRRTNKKVNKDLHLDFINSNKTVEEMIEDIDFIDKELNRNAEKSTNDYLK